jgi:hypothetical protein
LDDKEGIIASLGDVADRFTHAAKNRAQQAAPLRRKGNGNRNGNGIGNFNGNCRSLIRLGGFGMTSRLRFA